MYRLVLYLLIIWLGIGVLFGALGIIPYSPVAIIFSSLLFVASCYLTNQLFSKVFSAPTNVESVYITALILALIVLPGTTLNNFFFIIMVSILAMASKYLLAIEKKHLFNPAAIAVVLTALFSGMSANWRVGTISMFPFVLVGGLLIIRKIRREDMAFSFFMTAFVTILIAGIIKGSNLLTLFRTVVFETPAFFFAFVMLTEPLTAPVTKKLQIVYAAIVGFFFAPQIHLGSLYFTPELALVIGNVFSYVVSPAEKLIMKVHEVIQTAPDTYDFIFPLDGKLAYQPGQYMEWTLPHAKADSRGNRRYFTLASSPTEDNLRIGVKFNHPSSSFKEALLKGGSQIVAAQRAGEFTLPKDPNEKLVFIAGGIGITPFRSMVKYSLDKNEVRDIVLFYSVKQTGDAVYNDIFADAIRKLGIKVIIQVGRVDKDMIEKEVSDYKERKFYLSGPHAMVEAFKTTLREMGVARGKIKEDFFPGFV